MNHNQRYMKNGGGHNGRNHNAGSYRSNRSHLQQQQQHSNSRGTWSSVTAPQPSQTGASFVEGKLSQNNLGAGSKEILNPIPLSYDVSNSQNVRYGDDLSPPFMVQQQHISPYQVQYLQQLPFQQRQVPYLLTGQNLPHLHNQPQQQAFQREMASFDQQSDHSRVDYANIPLFQLSAGSQYSKHSPVPTGNSSINSAGVEHTDISECQDLPVDRDSAYSASMRSSGDGNFPPQCCAFPLPQQLPFTFLENSQLSDHPLNYLSIHTTLLSQHLQARQAVIERTTELSRMLSNFSQDLAHDRLGDFSQRLETRNIWDWWKTADFAEMFQIFLMTWAYQYIDPSLPLKHSSGVQSSMAEPEFLDHSNSSGKSD